MIASTSTRLGARGSAGTNDCSGLGSVAESSLTSFGRPAVSNATGSRSRR